MNRTDSRHTRARLARALLAVGVIFVAWGATCLATTAPDNGDIPAPESVTLSPESIAPFQVDIDLNGDTDTVHTDRVAPSIPVRQANEWRKATCTPIQDSIPLRLLLVATQAAATDL